VHVEAAALLLFINAIITLPGAAATFLGFNALSGSMYPERIGLAYLCIYLISRV